jgi:SAM-dependent methyltransferase
MKRQIKAWLERAGLLRVALRAYESWQAVRPTETSAVYRAGIGHDGLPVPPRRLVVSVGGHNNVWAFVEGGRLIAGRIEAFLEKNGLQMQDFASVLDFGCGSGRVIRHWRLPAKTLLCGTDYNGKAIAWCSRNLPFASFHVNGPMPPLDCHDGTFDFVYAFSVFTHFSEAAQWAWIRELARVVRPAGHVVISVHGASFVQFLNAAEAAVFSEGNLVVRHGSLLGTNMCAAFHPPQFVQRLLREHFELMDTSIVQGDQDLLLLRRL